MSRVLIGAEDESEIFQATGATWGLKAMRLCGWPSMGAQTSGDKPQYAGTGDHPASRSGVWWGVHIAPGDLRFSPYTVSDVRCLESDR